MYSGSRVDSELLRSVLEGSGIECALWGTGSTYVPETGAKQSAVRVMVRPADLDRAREVIDAAGVGDLDLEAQDDWETADAGIGDVESPSERRAGPFLRLNDPSRSTRPGHVVLAPWGRCHGEDRPFVGLR